MLPQAPVLPAQELATKADLVILELTLKAELRKEISDATAELGKEISDAKAELSKEISDVKAGVKNNTLVLAAVLIALGLKELAPFLKPL